jgi:hypothetical protein
MNKEVGMAKTRPVDPNDPAEVARQLNGLIQDITNTVSPALQALSKFQEQRAARLTEALTQIKEIVGEDHPDYGIVRDAAAWSAQMASQFKTQALRVEKWPAPNTSQWLMHGQVLDQTGQPAGALKVQVFDPEHKYDRETNTDQDGDFAIFYNKSDFAELGENLPELSLLVADQKGRTLYSARDKVRFRAGRLEYFLIRLGEGSGVPKEGKATGRQRKRGG